MNSCPQFRPYWFGSRFPFSLIHEIVSLVLAILVRIKEYICMKSHLRFGLLVRIKEYAHHEIIPLGSAFLVRIKEYINPQNHALRFDLFGSKQGICTSLNHALSFGPFGSDRGFYILHEIKEQHIFHIEILSLVSAIWFESRMHIFLHADMS